MLRHPSPLRGTERLCSLLHVLLKSVEEDSYQAVSGWITRQPCYCFKDLKVVRDIGFNFINKMHASHASGTKYSHSKLETVSDSQSRYLPGTDGISPRHPFAEADFACPWDMI